MTSVLDLGTIVFALGPAMATVRTGCAVVVLPGDSRALVVNDWVRWPLIG